MKKVILTLIFWCVLAAFADRTPVKPAGDGTEDSPYEIACLENFVWLSENLSSFQEGTTVYCKQTQDILASETKGEEWSEAGGFPVIMTAYSGILNIKPFILNYNGQGFAIKNPYIRMPMEYVENVGIFRCGNFQLKNIVIEDAEVQYCGRLGSGILVGKAQGNSVIENCSVSGTIESKLPEGMYVEGIGGLIGQVYAQYNNSISISQCKARVQANGQSSIGGLIGEVRMETNSHLRISRCYAENDTEYSSGFGETGGLIGFFLADGNAEFSIEDCYAAFNLEMDSSFPGRETFAGGFIGSLSFYPNFSTTNYINDVSVNISRCYATGNIKGDFKHTGGFLAFKSVKSLTVTNCYFDTTTFGLEDSFAIAKTHDELKSEVTFENWDFDNVWYIEEGVSLPTLAWELPEPGMLVLAFLCLLSLNRRK